MSHDLGALIRRIGGANKLSLNQLHGILGAHDERSISIHVQGGQVVSIGCPNALNIFVVVYSDGQEDVFSFPATQMADAPLVPLDNPGALEECISALVTQGGSCRREPGGVLTYDDYVERYGPMVTVITVVNGRVAVIQHGGGTDDFTVRYDDGSSREFGWPATQS